MSFNKMKLIGMLSVPVAALILSGCGSDAYVRDAGGDNGVIVPPGGGENPGGGNPGDGENPGGENPGGGGNPGGGNPGDGNDNCDNGNGGGNDSGDGCVPGVVVPDNMMIDTRDALQYILSVNDQRTTPPTRILGIIDNGANKITQALHYNVAGSTAQLGAYKTTVTLAPELSEEGESGVKLTFSWPAQQVGSEGYIIGTVTVDDSAGNNDGRFIVKTAALDGNYYGRVLAIFNYPTTTVDHSQFTLKATAYVHNRTDTEIYRPVVGPDGSIWLNFNLGAEYAKVGGSHFNPDAVPTSNTDQLAYGYLWQWGRVADGHQLVSYPDNVTGVGVNGTTTVKADNPGNSLFILSEGDWRVNRNDLLWRDINTPNQVCPKDWRLATEEEWFSVRDGSGGNGAGNYGTFIPPSFLHLQLTGMRSNADGLVYGAGVEGDYWTSQVRGAGTQAMHLERYTLDSSFISEVKAVGNPVRCRYGK